MDFYCKRFFSQVIWIAIISSLLLVGRSLGDDSLRQRLLSEAPKHWKALKSLPFEGELTRDEEFRITPNSYRRFRTKFLVHGELVVLQTSYQAGSGEHRTATDGIVGINSQYAFTLNRKGGSDSSVPYALTYAGPLTESVRSSLVSLNYIRASWQFAGKSLDQWLQGPGYELKKISSTLRKGKMVVEVECAFYDEKTKERELATFYLDPEQKWAIQGVIYNQPMRTIREDIEYTELNGMPVPLRITISTGHNDEIWTEEKTQFSNLTHRLASESEFTLSAFGFPEPAGVVWRKPTPAYVWFLAAAALCLVIALGFQFGRRWRRKAPG